MPATTRGRTKQAHIDNPNEVKAPAQTKRKAQESTSDQGNKKQKTVAEVKPEAKPTERDDEKPSQPEDKNVVTINRAPVLELWAATVTSFLHEGLSWETCLSAGSAISTLCAISKGRSIGAVEPPDPETAEKKRQERQERAEKEQLEELEVMGFNLRLKDGSILVSDKPKKANESALTHKFGEQAYVRTKASFEQALESWRGAGEGLNAQAFHMYEDFRPTVPPGQKGWGRRGQLNLQAVKDAVTKPE